MQRFSLGLFTLFTIFSAFSYVAAAPNWMYPYTGGFSYAGPYRGAYAGAGAGFWPFGGMGWPVFGWPVMPPVPMINWYEGEHVCKETKVCKELEDLNDWLKDDQLGSWLGDFHEQSTSCKGSDSKTVCRKTVTTNEGTKTEYTKYECCPGFVRPLDGSPGCVEKPGTPSDGTSQESPAPSPVKWNDHSRYSYLQSSSSSSSSNYPAKTGVEQVPAQ